MALAAWWRPGPVSARRLYQFLSLYLGLLLAASVADVLII